MSPPPSGCVRHQAIQIQANAVKPTALRKLGDKTLAVSVSLEDIAAIVATNGNVVDGTLIDDTQRPSHSQTIPGDLGFGNTELKFLRVDPKASQGFPPSEKATIHHNAGNCYNSFRNKTRIIREIEAELKTDEELLDLLGLLNSQRDEINEKSPQIPKWAFRKARKGIEEGETNYKIDSTS